MQRLEETLTPIKQVKYGRLYHISKWINEGYLALVKRHIDCPLTAEEMGQIESQDLARIAKLRERKIAADCWLECRGYILEKIPKAERDSVLRWWTIVLPRGRLAQDHMCKDGFDDNRLEKMIRKFLSMSQ